MILAKDLSSLNNLASLTKAKKKLNQCQTKAI